MILWLRNITAYIIVSIASVAIVRWIQSSVVTDVLIPNLTTIVIALLAINVQTTAVIAVKLRELADRQGCDFTSSIRQFRLAIGEQAALVVISLALSAIVKTTPPAFPSLASDLLAFFVTYASLHIFVDTSIGLIIALFPSHKRD